MPLSKTDKDTLEEIVKVDGQCLDSKRCSRCPFRAICLPEFLNTVPPSQSQRLQMALDVLTHHYIIDDDVNVDDINKDFNWDKK